LRSWTSAAELRERVLHDWEQGRLPAALLGGPSPFPLRLKLKGPDSSELAERFDEVRSWIASLSESAASPGYRLEWREINHRQLGRNKLPVAAIFDQAEPVLAFAGKRREAGRLVQLAGGIVAAFPQLRDWLIRRPLTVLEQAADWPALLATLAWFRSHPRSGRYTRQIDASGVHSKLVESHRGLLAELLDLVLPPEAIDRSAGGAEGFARRYGLRDKPRLLRFRILDPALDLAVGLAAGDPHLRVQEISLPADDFARLIPARGDCAPSQVFITENEINFLSFPNQAAGIIIFGSGYGFAALAQAAWLHRCRIRYWGDLDSHGFAILDQLRADFPEAESLLMDRATLLAHREQWTTEASPTKVELTRLRSEEKELYDDLRAGRLAPALRLEQERIGFAWVESTLSEH
jgi:hypothetical protein